jgi:hypothetical protein
MEKFKENDLVYCKDTLTYNWCIGRIRNVSAISEFCSINVIFGTNVTTYFGYEMRHLKPLDCFLLGINR